MSPVSEKEQHCQVLLHFCNQGVHAAKELHNLMNILLWTIYYITASSSRILGQQIQYNSSNSLRTLATQLSKNSIKASYQGIWKVLVIKKVFWSQHQYLPQTIRKDALNGPESTLTITGRNHYLWMRQPFSSLVTP